ncbi:MAG: hypothetical protein QM754_08255 [Tepidisphaeraceae bacterium]
MLIDPFWPVRKRRRVKVRAMPATPTASGPVLVEAVYESMTAVTLTFERAVSVTVDMLTGVHVTDGDQGEAYHGENYEMLSPTSVHVNLYYDQPYSGPGVTLTAIADTGIVAANDGSAWAGVTDVALPFVAEAVSR